MREIRLSAQEKQEFLAEPRVAVPAAGGGDGPPIASPVWYSYTPVGDVRVLTPTGSAKARAIRASGVATLVIDTVSPRTRHVAVGCTLVDEREGTKADHRELAERYLPADKVGAYMEFAGSIRRVHR